MIELSDGDIFATPADIRVNTVNCVGVMGTGIALMFKKRYPEMFREYQRECKKGEIKPGKLHIWRSLAGEWVINFPTKDDWKDPSRYEYISDGLDALHEYLRPLGSVTISVPALGCGNGGLDWSRVSKMITEKLQDVDAQVHVFPPSSSRRKLEHLSGTITDQELEDAEKLGYSKGKTSLTSLSNDKRIFFLKGDIPDTRRWIALLPSKAPGEREQAALLSIAKELGKRKQETCVALVHSTQASEEIAEVFACHGVDTILVLPFGVLTRKSVSRWASQKTPGSIALLSPAPPSEKWSRQLFAQSMEILRSRASALVLSDPEPEWLVKRSKDTWRDKAIFYLRYDNIREELRNALTDIGAVPIAKRAAEGSPNLEAVLAAGENEGSAQTLRGDGAVQAYAESAAGGAESKDSTSQTTEAPKVSHVIVDLASLPSERWLEAIHLLQKSGAESLILDARIPIGGTTSATKQHLNNLRLLRELGASESGVSD